MRASTNLKRLAADIPDEPLELVPVRVESAPLRQKIVAALRRAIELGTLAPGERLIEKDLCAKLSVSRTSLREALRDLEANGVVTNLSVRGLVVTPLSREEITNMYRVRGAIEFLVAEQFIKFAAGEDIAELRSALARLRTAVGSSTATLDAQRNYYEIWCKGARNPFAFEILMNIQLRLSVIRSTVNKTDLRLQNIAEKEAILDRMENKDMTGAQAAVRRHVKNATVAALRGIKP